MHLSLIHLIIIALIRLHLVTTVPHPPLNHYNKNNLLNGCDAASRLYSVSSQCNEKPLNINIALESIFGIGRSGYKLDGKRQGSACFQSISRYKQHADGDGIIIVLEFVNSMILIELVNMMKNVAGTNVETEKTAISQDVVEHLYWRQIVVKAESFKDAKKKETHVNSTIQVKMKMQQYNVRAVKHYLLAPNRECNPQTTKSDEVLIGSSTSSSTDETTAETTDEINSTSSTVRPTNLTSPKPIRMFEHWKIIVVIIFLIFFLLIGIAMFDRFYGALKSEQRKRIICRLPRLTIKHDENGKKIIVSIL